MSQGPGPESRGAVLHSSRVGLIGAIAGTALVLVLALLVTVSEAGPGVRVGVVSFAVLVLVSVLFDMPVTAEFDSDGVTRANLLRRHRLVWDDVDRLKRTRVGLWRHTPKRRGGGLVAKVGFRHYLLVDQMESRAEFESVRTAIGADLADALGLGPDLRPPDSRKPTRRFRPPEPS